jgi:hypothetical protein
MRKNIFILFFILFFATFLRAQERSKDTLFFKYDNKYIKTYTEIPKHYYLDDIKGGGNGNFFFDEIHIVNNMKKKKMLCLKEFVHDPKFYNEKQKLDDYKLGVYLNKHIVYLVRKNEYIQVQATHEID